MEEAQWADLQLGLMVLGYLNLAPTIATRVVGYSEIRLVGELGCRKSSLSFQNVFGVGNAANTLFQYCRARKDVIDNDCGFPPLRAFSSFNVF